MAATTISRQTITNDSGSGTDGTILNASFFGTAVYDKVDALFTGDNLITENTVNGARTFRVSNMSAGTAASAQLAAGNDLSTTQGRIIMYGSGVTPSGTTQPDTLLLHTSGAGGIRIVAADASGEISCHSGGSTTRSSFVAAGGHWVFVERSANVDINIMTANAAMAMYTKADKLVFAYNNAGTLTYIHTDLDAPGSVTWTKTTTAP